MSQEVTTAINFLNETIQRGFESNQVELSRIADSLELLAKCVRPVAPEFQESAGVTHIFNAEVVSVA